MSLSREQREAIRSRGTVSFMGTEYRATRNNELGFPWWFRIELSVRLFAQRVRNFVMFITMPRNIIRWLYARRVGEVFIPRGSEVHESEESYRIFHRGGFSGGRYRNYSEGYIFKK